LSLNWKNAAEEFATSLARVGIRALQPDPAQADAWIKQNRIYPYAMPEINAYVVASRHRFSDWSRSD
jgi:hypothetical protein